MLELSVPGSSWEISEAPGPDPNRLEESDPSLESLPSEPSEPPLRPALAVSCWVSWLTSTCSNSSAVV